MKIVIILILFVFFIPSISDATTTWQGNSEWNVNVFASPGMPGSDVNNISAIAISPWENSKEYKVYAAGFKISAGGGTDRYIYDFIWNGSTWIKNEFLLEASTSGYADLWKIIKCIYFENLRGDTTRLYAATINGNVSEYEFDGVSNEWKLKSNVKSENNALGIEGVLISDIKNGKDKMIYAMNGAISWDSSANSGSGGWQAADKIRYKADYIYAINEGYWSDKKRRCLYLRYTSTPDLVDEIEFDGSSWAEISTIKVSGADDAIGISSLFVADVGNGMKLYVMDKGGISECYKRPSGQWKITPIDLYTTENIAAISYGRISDSDPYSIYALVSHVAVGDPYNEKNANEVHEWIYRKDLKKWVKTCVMRLYEPKMVQSSSFVRTAGALVTAKMFMVNARNEKVADPATGALVDQYNRLYIVDKFGTLWECSVPPRKFRPPDPDDPYNPNNPDYQDPDDPNNPINIIIPREKPSILGGGK